ncbi:hypothetical protein [Bradyrhizobium genosp. P]|uniref:hypothetical protein n=1 Tax=Bradyrhizobium genosp. P TaxID=83641 RepID=UPI003CF11605
MLLAKHLRLQASLWPSSAKSSSSAALCPPFLGLPFLGLRFLVETGDTSDKGEAFARG